MAGQSIEKKVLEKIKKGKRGRLLGMWQYAASYQLIANEC